MVDKEKVVPDDQFGFRGKHATINRSDLPGNGNYTQCPGNKEILHSTTSWHKTGFRSSADTRPSAQSKRVPTDRICSVLQ